MTKPYRVKELLARVAVNIRRYTQARQTSQENSNRVVTFGNTAYDGEAFVLTQHGEKLYDERAAVVAIFIAASWTGDQSECDHGTAL